MLDENWNQHEALIPGETEVMQEKQTASVMR